MDRVIRQVRTPIASTVRMAPELCDSADGGVFSVEEIFDNVGLHPDDQDPGLTTRVMSLNQLFMAFRQAVVPQDSVGGYTLEVLKARPAAKTNFGLRRHEGAFYADLSNLAAGVQRVAEPLGDEEPKLNGLPIQDLKIGGDFYDAAAALQMGLINAAHKARVAVAFTGRSIAVYDADVANTLNKTFLYSVVMDDADGEKVVVLADHQALPQSPAQQA